MERLAMRGGWKPKPGLICDFFFISLVTEILHLSGKSQGISKSTMDIPWYTTRPELCITILYHARENA